jgi:hypothetical protein
VLETSLGLSDVKINQAELDSAFQNSTSHYDILISMPAYNAVETAFESSDVMGSLSDVSTAF